jgi:hypothetical protein
MWSLSALFFFYRSTIDLTSLLRFSTSCILSTRENYRSVALIASIASGAFLIVANAAAGGEQTSSTCVTTAALRQQKEKRNDNQQQKCSTTSNYKLYVVYLTFYHL